MKIKQCSHISECSISIVSEENDKYLVELGVDAKTQDTFQTTAHLHQALFSERFFSLYVLLTDVTVLCGEVAL